jgi:predicted nucleotidyltransferase
VSKIRLSDYNIESIKKTFHEVFLDKDELWVFGSRVHPEKKGGDIDLYVETNIESASDVVSKRSTYLVKLEKRIGEQKIDLVIKRKKDKTLLIHKIAKNEGIRLI